MAGGHEGVFEDGVLSTCGICGCRVHMLDPDEMDWICDPCSTEGWAGFTSAYKLRRGNVVSIRGTVYTVLGTSEVGRFTELELRDHAKPGTALRFMRGTAKVYVHERGETIA